MYSMHLKVRAHSPEVRVEPGKQEQLSLFCTVDVGIWCRHKVGYVHAYFGDNCKDKKHITKTLFQFSD